MKKLLRIKTYPWVKEAIIRKYGVHPIANFNNTLGAEMAQETIEIEASERLFEIGPRVFNGFYTRMLIAQLISFVDGQRALKITIEDSIANFLAYMQISEEKMPIDTALKLYKYHRPKK